MTNSLYNNSFLASSFSGIQIFASPHHPTEFSHWAEERRKWKAHPIVCWLAKWFPVKPYVECSYKRPVTKDCDPLFHEAKGIIYCSLAQEAAIRRQFE